MHQLRFEIDTSEQMSVALPVELSCWVLRREDCVRPFHSLLGAIHGPLLPRMIPGLAYSTVMNARRFISNLKQFHPGQYLEFKPIVTEDLRNMKGCDSE